MAASPLPGAPYHTADLAFYSYPDVDPEAVRSYGSEKVLSLQTSHGTARPRRGPPVLLILLLLCCLAFVASAFTGSASGPQFFQQLCVPESHASLADQISATFRTKSQMERVYETQAGALHILKQTYNTSRVGCHAADVRDYMRRSYPVVKSSLDWTNVSRSAVVLHWQGADRRLKPVVITNNPEVLGPEEQNSITRLNHAQFGDEKVIEHIEDLADVQSAVGMLTAVEALVQSGYQPSRTLVLSLMLGEASDARKVNEYLHATYDKHGVEMGIWLPASPECPSRRLPRMLDDLRGFFDGLYMRVAALFSTPHCPSSLFDDDGPRFHRHVLEPEDRAAFSASAVGPWTNMILGAGSK